MPARALSVITRSPHRFAGAKRVELGGHPIATDVAVRDGTGQAARQARHHALIMNLVVTVTVAALLVVAVSLLIARRQEQRRHKPVSDAVARVSRRHRGQAAL